MQVSESDVLYIVVQEKQLENNIYRQLLVWTIALDRTWFSIFCLRWIPESTETAAEKYRLLTNGSGQSDDR